jgi:hypothetical protein
VAEGEGGKVTGKMSRFVELVDHPLLFAFAITLMVVPMMALMTSLFKWLGWAGPAALVQHP